MSNYLIMPKNFAELYFYKPYEGICVRKCNPQGVWQEHESVLSGGRDGFGIFCTRDKNVHLICTDHSNNLIYAVNDAGVWKKYVISKLGTDISVSDIRIYSVRGRLNFIYSALYNGENLLVHCILGDHAKPSTVDICETPHFFIKGNRIYYTNSKGILGFVNTSDEKPSGFNPVYENAHFGTVYDIDGKEKILFARDGSVFLNEKEIAHDIHLEMPILVDARGKIYVMWKNSGFVRYVSSDDCENFGKPMRFMGTGQSMAVYTAQKGEGFFNYYGYQNAGGLVLLGNPDIFEKSLDYRAKKEEELERVKALLNQTQKEVISARKEIARLGKVIGNLTENKKRRD